jgi:peptide/nickel transport system substrate-binding protein
MHKKFPFAMILTVLSLWLAACGGGGIEPTSPPAGGSGVTPPPAVLSLDPANTAGENGKAAAAYLYEGLVSMKDGQITGVLAESYSVSDDGLDYIFNLRPGVSFHDGEPLDADAVIANFTRWYDPASPLRGDGSYAAWVAAFNGFKGETAEDGKAKSQYDGIEKTNDLTVLVHLNSPDPEFLQKISDPAFSIVSPAVLAQGGEDGGTNKYKSAGIQDGKLTLEPFAGYWDPAAIPSEGMEVSFDKGDY